jgi:hypothetical protein
MCGAASKEYDGIKKVGIFIDAPNSFFVRTYPQPRLLDWKGGGAARKPGSR